MATKSKTNPAATSSNNWTVLATGPQVITAVSATPAGGTAQVSLRLRRGSVDYMIQSPKPITESSRIWTDEIALEAGDSLSARSDTATDWYTSGYVEVVPA